MPTLKNPKQELVAQGVTKGLSADAAYKAAGYKPNRGNAIRMKANESIAKRVEELKSGAAEKAMVSRQWVLERLVENVKRAMQVETVLDREGKSTGEYTYQGSVANKRLELLGKEIGMFVERREEDGALAVRMTVDVPPHETREQWLARRSRELGVLTTAAVVPGNGRDNR